MQRKPARTPATGPGTEPVDAAKRAARIRLAVIVAALLAIAGFALAIYLEIRKDAIHERWDILEELSAKHQPAQDPVWENPYGVYNPERERYIAALEKFLDMKAKEYDDALAPHTRFVLAKTIADHILSNPGILDMDARSAFYAKGVAQLEAIRDEYPDFPLNWTTFSSDGYPSLTRHFLEWFRANEQWEKEYLLRPRDPAADVRVLIRTERGDMLLGLYTEEASAWTTAFLERVKSGFYDGTAFAVREEVGDAAEPEKHFVLAGGSATRGIKDFDAKNHLEVSKAKERAGRLPEESRNLIPHQRGIVAAWHDLADEYDTDSQFLISSNRSPMLDYRYTPVGRLLDEQKVTSYKTLDRIFGADTWREDSEVRNDTDLGGVLDFLQAPVRIVKVLAYVDGKLERSEEDAASEFRAALEDDERQLSSVEPDRYKKEPPVRPKPPKDEPGAGEDSPKEPAGGEK